MTDAGDHRRARGGAERGRQADSPREVPVLGWKEIVVRTWAEASKDNIALIAAGVAFYGFLALVPLLGAIVLTYGLIASPESVFRSLNALTGVLPPNVARLIGDMLINVIRSSGNKKGIGIAFALVLALWGARNAAGSIIIALNVAYEEDEKRSFIHKTLLALTMTIAAVVLALAGVAATALLSMLAQVFPGWSGTMRLIGRIVTYPVLAFGAAGAAATVYRYGPSRERARWSWITPGSLFSAVGWMLLTVGFGLYVTHFAHYDATYGALGSVVALLTWMYLSSYVFLFGAELNSEVEHQTARDTTAGGAKPLGERGAWSADHVADGADDEGSEDERRTSPVAEVQDESRDGDAGPDEAGNAAAAAGEEHSLVVSRIASRSARMLGSPKVGMAMSLLSTAGLSLLRKRGKARAGAVLVAAAVGLALLKREPEAKD